MGKKIIFLSSQLSLPRIIKRVTSFSEKGYEVEIYGFSRSEFLNGNSYPERIKVHSFGFLPDGQSYLHSLKEHHKFISKIIKQENHNDVVYYAIGFIPALICFLYAKRSYLYEISDLIYGTFKYSQLSAAFAFMDSLMIKKSLLTVLTSQGFSDYLFNGKQPNNVIVQPNRLNSTFFSKVGRPKPLLSPNLRFGFVGYLRYTNTVFRFAMIIGEKFPDYSFSFYGDSKYAKDAKAMSEKYENVHFFGKFKSPDDLSSIYSNLDVIVACYDTSTFNEKVAEPNKLYESLFFCKPIIVSPNIFLSKRVCELRCGYEIDATNDSVVENFIKNLKHEELEAIAQHEYEMGLSEMIDNPNDIFAKVNI